MTTSRKAKYRLVWTERWCPPKPLVGLTVINKVLSRHTETSGPETRLVIALIVRAIDGCLSRGNGRMRREARRFLLSDQLDWWCDHIGINPDFVRLVARKAGYLADEKAYWQQVQVKVRIEPEAAPDLATQTTSHSGEPLHA